MKELEGWDSVQKSWDINLVGHVQKSLIQMPTPTSVV